ncbi:MAG: hypothetical protein V4550_18205 [Gemmatimonadota bacterium]
MNDELKQPRPRPQSPRIGDVQVRPGGLDARGLPASSPVGKATGLANVPDSRRGR